MGYVFLENLFDTQNYRVGASFRFKWAIADLEKHFDSFTAELLFEREREREKYSLIKKRFGSSLSNSKTNFILELFQINSSNLHTFLDNHEKQLLFGINHQIESKLYIELDLCGLWKWLSFTLMSRENWIVMLLSRNVPKWTDIEVSSKSLSCFQVVSHTCD